MPRIAITLLLFIYALLLQGCDDTSGQGAAVDTGQPKFEAIFDPSASKIPFPDDLLFTDTTDGTLNIPVANPNDLGDPKVAMNTLDGFSTLAPITTTFAVAADPATLADGVHVFEVTTTLQGAITSVVRELGATEYQVSLVGDTTLSIQPLFPLKSNTRYLVVLTSDIKSTNGLPLVPSSTFGLAKGSAPLVDGAGNSQFSLLTDTQAQSLEPLRQLTQSYLSAAEAQGIPAATVALAWTFKTQTLNKVLPAIRADSVNNPPASANFIYAGTGLGATTMSNFASTQGGALQTAFNAGSFNKIASVVTGAVKLPYYLSNDGTGDLANGVFPGAVTDHFSINTTTGLPTIKSTENVPFLLTIPNSTGPWPVVIFQHGFTVDKTAMFGIANSLAQAGFAAIAIDSVLHGSRTFGLDLVTQDANGKITTNVPDGQADSSGQWYLNLQSLLTFRDNIRQSVADLIHLTRLLEVQSMDVVNNTTGAPGADNTPDLMVKTSANTNNPPISFVGHSNGGILGTLLAAVEPNIQTYVLANPGGIYADIASHSTEISPLVNAGLAAKGIQPGTADYNAFFVAAQTVLDDGDPVNAATSASARNILLFKQKDDPVVPNSSTDALSAALGLKQVTAPGSSGSVWQLGAVASPHVGNGFVFFIQGGHSSFLRPDPPNTTLGLDIITEMQTETAKFLGSALQNSATITISGAPASASQGSGAAITTIVQ